MRADPQKPQPGIICRGAQLVELERRGSDVVIGENIGAAFDEKLLARIRHGRMLCRRTPA